MIFMHLNSYFVSYKHNYITKHLYGISLGSLTHSLLQYLHLAGFSLLCSSTAFTYVEPPMALCRCSSRNFITRN